jgi:hypothetical protein
MRKNKVILILYFYKAYFGEKYIFFKKRGQLIIRNCTVVNQLHLEREKEKQKY